MVKTKFHSSGLTLILDKNDTPVVSCRLRVNVGSTNETDDNRGVSHFLEHMVFNGTKTKTKEDILYKVPATGASQNAYTTFDHTVYMIDGTSSNFEICLDTLCDMVLNPSLSEDSIQKEINVVLQELGDADNNPNSVAWDAFMKEVFQGNEIDVPILGTEESIKNFTSEKTREYHQKYYIPANMILSISGVYDEDILDKIVSTYFKDDSGSKTPEVIHKFSPENIIKSPNNFFQDQIMCCYHFNWYDDITVELVNAILGTDMNSILFKTIREEMGLVYNIGSYVTNINQSKMVIVVANCDSDKTDEIIGLIPEVSRKTYLISEEELQGGKNKLLYHYAESFANKTKNADNNLDCYVENKTVRSFEEIKNKIDKIKMNDFVNVARGILSQKPLIVASVANSKNKE